MANWQQNAINDLREYPALEQSLQNIPEEIRQLEGRVLSLKSVGYDKTPVMGGGSGREEALIEYIDRKERLRINLEIARQKVERIDRGLGALDQRERLVLQRFYVRREYGYLDRLCEELGYERTHVYRLKDQALMKFTLSMFGVLNL